MKYLAIMTVAAAMVAACGTAVAQPKPSPISDAWSLDIEVQPLQAIEVKIPGQGMQKFWFLRYTVTNDSKADQIFVPEFLLYTDAGDLVRAQKGVSPVVFDKIKEIFNDPTLKDQTAMTGKILQGEDNALNGVAIFKDFDGIAGEVHIFVGGLSGETVKVDLPVEVQVKDVNAKGEPVVVPKKQVVLTRTLDLKYLFPGNPAAKTSREQLNPKDKTWVMR